MLPDTLNVRPNLKFNSAWHFLAQAQTNTSCSNLVPYFVKRTRSVIYHYQPKQASKKLSYLTSLSQDLHSPFQLHLKNLYIFLANKNCKYFESICFEQSKKLIIGKLKKTKDLVFLHSLKQGKPVKFKIL